MSVCCCATSWQGVELHVSRNEAISGVTGASTPASIYNTVQVRRNPTNPVRRLQSVSTFPVHCSPSATASDDWQHGPRHPLALSERFGAAAGTGSAPAPPGLGGGLCNGAMSCACFPSPTPRISVRVLAVLANVKSSAAVGARKPAADGAAQPEDLPRVHLRVHRVELLRPVAAPGHEG